MGIDGFSMGNLGLHKEVTSAHRANEAEHLALKGMEFKIKDVGELSKGKKVKIRNDEEHKKNKRQQPQPDKDETDLTEIHIEDVDFEDTDPKNFSVRINKDTELIELVDNQNKRVIETITANELMFLVSKLNSASGVLVNKKI